MTPTKLFVFTIGKINTWHMLENATPDGTNNDWLKLDCPKSYLRLYN
jgi:hypothetical protein